MSTTNNNDIDDAADLPTYTKAEPESLASLHPPLQSPSSLFIWNSQPFSFPLSPFQLST